MFVTLKKTPKGSIISLNTPKNFSGTMFLSFNNKVMKAEFPKSHNAWELPKEFVFDCKIIIVCFVKNEVFVGASENVSDCDYIVDKIQTIYNANNKLKIKSQENLYNKELVIENIIYKLFNQRSMPYFELVKDKLDNLFLYFERDKVVEKSIPFSKFVRIEDGEENYYVGIIYKNNLPFAIGIGVDNLTDKQMREEVCYQLFCNNEKSQKEGNSQDFVCFTFRSCFDGENIWLK